MLRALEASKEVIFPLAFEVTKEGRSLQVEEAADAQSSGAVSVRQVLRVRLDVGRIQAVCQLVARNCVGTVARTSL